VPGKLGRAVRVKDCCYFFVGLVIVLGEGVGGSIVGASKPLAVFPDSLQEVMGGMVMSHFEFNCCLNWVFAILDEYGFLEPTFQC
jgi:hypothetical protein